MKRWPGLLSLICAVAATAQSLPDARQRELVRMVRQDCGSCHGMRLSGGLGPALTQEALHGRSRQALAAVILHGRPGTPMPGWAAMLTPSESEWIAAQLMAGFPKQARGEP